MRSPRQKPSTCSTPIAPLCEFGATSIKYRGTRLEAIPIKSNDMINVINVEVVHM